ncbi:hypothetical protein QR680_000930 [Steinernema hermaphroditum]|uniref:protein-tyrosine-phosphatase n=1 Tax=Steinernema hermaphroditum TaxID=289476 RepID=A0AA39GX82_9BILA|nr:hypothetical protein QR680_000930 [Steinernema hermaphroditum]
MRARRIRSFCFLLFILLRLSDGLPLETNTIPTTFPDELPVEVPEIIPKAPEELNVPVCHSDHDCTYRGVCQKDTNGTGQCSCPTTCPTTIPLTCSHNLDCLTMGDEYERRYTMPPPICHQERCVCPPLFDSFQSTIRTELGYYRTSSLPPKCDKRDLQVFGIAIPSDAVYRGTEAILLCCLNIDPREVVPSHGLTFVHNGTVVREASATPYNENSEIDDNYSSPKCWTLNITNAQLSDSGSYICTVKTRGKHQITVNSTIEFLVKEVELESVFLPDLGNLSDIFVRRKKGEIVDQDNSTLPRMIRNLTVTPNATFAEVKWEVDEGPMLKIDLRLLLRPDKTEVWAKSHAQSGLIIPGLKPGQTYTLFITVTDGQSEPFQLTNQFVTAEISPGPPVLEDIRLINAADGLLQCEVEWFPPVNTNGWITKYYVTVRGAVRHSTPGGALAGDHFPEAVQQRCANYIGDSQSSLNPIDFISSNQFFSCQFGPLKPNRNYTATVWAENDAGRSEPATFTSHCVTNYAEPDHIEQPTLTPGNGRSTFGLSFAREPDDTNGPVACYYLAIVPLLLNVSIDKLPHPENMVVDTFSKTLMNNQKPSADPKKQYFAYIAESYMQYPKETLIGDGNTTAGMEACNVLYLSRHRAEDHALKPDMKYTGFLIARVDLDESLLKDTNRFHFTPHRMRRTHVRSPYLRFPLGYNQGSGGSLYSRRHRQLQPSDPAYGFSTYFKPVFLSPEPAPNAQSMGSVVLIFVFVLIMFLAALTGIGFFLHRQGLIKRFWSKDHQRLRQGFQPINADDLPNEYIIRHRDSDFLFTAEFESLPNGKGMETTASDRRENKSKNRYQDIKAYDATRVKLRKINNDDSSDYINANYIKGYNGKKTFIAAQGPLDATIDDFWRMVWENDVRIVVMVANLHERYRVKCSKYWPDESVRLGNKIEVRAQGITYYSDYIVREFDLVYSGSHRNSFIRRGSTALAQSVPSLVNSGTSVTDPLNINGPLSEIGGSMDSNLDSDYANVPNLLSSRASRSSANKLSINNISENAGNRSLDVRRIVQYHYTDWNDYQAPESTNGLLRFVDRLRKMDEYNNYPVVIHCSAGVGRTGTFIAIDGVLDQCIEEGKVDIYGFVSDMRKQRNMMVQSLEQYVFVYKALAEHLLFGNTDLEVDAVYSHFERLKQPYRERQPSTTSSGTTSVSAMATAMLKNSKFPRIGGGTEKEAKPTGLEIEFNKLERTLDSVLPCTFACKDENILRNRIDYAVPFNRNRVILKSLVGDSNTYINASNVKGYFYPYIFAQDPMNASTCYDFWRMIYDHDCTALVMLSNEEDFAPSEKYWPEEISKPICFGPSRDVTVRLVHEETHPTFVMRIIEYKFRDDTSSGEWHEVAQFSTRCWPTGLAAPVSSQALLDLIGRVLDRQSNNPRQSPIVLHCRDGSAECGVYCCVSLLLERLKAEHRVDVFQTVKGLQAQRPRLFSRLEQYIFCYQAVIDYLNSVQERRSLAAGLHNHIGN